MDSTDLAVQDNLFWKTVEEISMEPIPLYLKRIITAAGYARYSALKNISGEFKSEIEGFAREQMTMFQKTPENFHIFHRDPRQFRIVPGHWNLLQEVSKKLSENKKQFLKVRFPL